MVESEKAPTPVHIIVDHRERVSGVHEHLLALPNVTVEFKELAFGDYWVNDPLIVERKTMRDFAESIIDGHIFTQAGWLAQRVEGVVFLAEQLLDKFLTVEKVMSTAQADLEAIAGIGPKTASAIRSVLS